MKPWLARRLPFLLVVTAAATLCSALAELNWFLELFSHFTPYYVVAALLLALIFGVLGRYRYAGAALALTAANGVLIALAFTPPKLPAPGPAGTQLTIFHFNVGFRHSDVGRVIAHVLAHAARYDVVVLIEAGTAWEREIEKLETAFPYTLRALDDTPFGLAVFTKKKPAAATLVEAPPGYKRAEVRLVIDGRALTVYAIHPPPPIDAQLAADRNESLMRVARAVAAERTPAVIVGDLNLTPYSPYFRKLGEVAGVQPARAQTFPRPTWPTPLANAWLGIPIDHSFVSRDIAVAAHEIGPDLGSDHLPVTLTVVLPAQRGR